MFKRLPQKEEAAAFIDVNYTVPGLFQFSNLTYSYLDIVESKFDWSIPIKYMYGSPSMVWNGGRILFNNELDCDINGIETELLLCKKHNIKPLLTFSNVNISDNDLDDSLGNYILNILNNINGGVIITSNKLKKYIYSEYPNVEIHASVAQTVLTNHRDIEYYQILASDYDYFVLHPDDNFNDEILLNIPKQNAELLINERCNYSCKLRRKHYESISREQRSKTKGCYINEHFLSHCKSIPEWKQESSSYRNISLSLSEVSRLINYGFKNLKLQGRTDNVFVYFFDFMRYTLENKVAFPNLYPIFSYEIEKFIRRETKNGTN